MVRPVDGGAYAPTAPAASNDLLTHLLTNKTHFKDFDTAKQRVESGGGGPDNIISKEDLSLVAADTRRLNFTAAEQTAARYLLDHPSDLAHLDVASKATNIPGIYAPGDDRIGAYDVNAAVRDAENFQGGQTFTGQTPSIPTANSTDAQGAAYSTLMMSNPGIGGGADGGQRVFIDELKQHKGETTWIRDYFRALGADQAGALLYGSLAQGGDSRVQARRALDSLVEGGMLNVADQQAAHFQTSPQSSADFSLKTLMDADKFQRQIDARRSAIAGTDHPPEDTPVNDAFDALLTVSSEPKASDLTAIANRYGVEPALLEGVVPAEMDFDFSGKDRIQDALWRNTPIHAGDGPGIASVHSDTLQWAVQYLQDHHLPGADTAARFLSNDFARDRGANFLNSSESAAIVLAALTDVRRSHGVSTTSATDMAVTWGAYRTGIRDVTPNGQGYTLDEFLNNRLNAQDAGNVVAQSQDSHALIGGNTYQSEPYFTQLLAGG